MRNPGVSVSSLHVRCHTLTNGYKIWHNQPQRRRKSFYGVDRPPPSSTRYEITHVVVVDTRSNKNPCYTVVLVVRACHRSASPEVSHVTAIQRNAASVICWMQEDRTARPSGCQYPERTAC